MNTISNIIFFGSTGLIGSKALIDILDVNTTLLAGDHQLLLKKFIEKEPIGSNKINKTELHFNVTKNIYCISRKCAHSPLYMNEVITEKNLSLDFNKEKFELIKSKLVNNSNNNESGTLMLETPNMDKSLKEEEFFPSKLNNIFYFLIRNKVEVVFSNNNPNQEKFLKFYFKVNVFQIILPDSNEWLTYLPYIFRSSTKLLPYILNGTQQQEEDKNKSFKKAFTHLVDVTELGTMICTLGTNVFKDQNKIDYSLTFDLANWFSNGPDKKLVIVTSFNNTFISNSLKYFKIKEKLENDLQNRLKIPLKDLIILRPGPLVGEHEVIKNDVTVVLKKSPHFLKQIWNYKTFLFKSQLLVFKDVMDFKPRTKICEWIAKVMYHLPGNYLIGYSVPAWKVSFLVAFEAFLQLPHDNLTTKDQPLTHVEIFTSKTIDNLIESN